MKRKKITGIFTLFCLAFTLNAQVWIPSVIGICGQTEASGNSYTAGQPYVSSGNQAAGLENLLWLPADTLFHYKLGEIPDAVVHHSTECRFRFAWEAHPDAVYSYSVTDRKDTSLCLENETGSAVFSYKPLSTDLSCFTIEFMAIQAKDTLRQLVLFTPVPSINPEYKVLTYLGDLNLTDSILIRKHWETGERMNFSLIDSLMTITLIGKTIVFENGQTPFTYQNLPNLKELNIYATRLIIRDTVHLPQTRVNIYCETLEFEDSEGIYASINTTPRSPDAALLNGLDARDFACYIRECNASGKAFRFIIRGGDGSPSYPIINTLNGTSPGGGGNGGNFYSNINLRSIVNPEGGDYGTLINWLNMPMGPKGKNGVCFSDPNPYKWMHPVALRFLLQDTRENYIYGHENIVSANCDKYIALLKACKSSSAWSEDTVNSLDLNQIYYSFSSLREQLDNNLDYYGNPKGWAPLLSFEANLRNYENEIAFSIRVLYLDYWMNKKAGSLAQKQETAEKIKGKSIEEIVRLKEDYAQAYSKYGPSLIEFRNYSAKLDTLTVQYDNKINELLEQAKNKVENSWESIFRKIGYIAGQVCKFIPMPQTQILGSALQTAASLDYDNPLSMDNWSKIHSTLNVALNEYSTLADNASGLIGGINPASLAEAGLKQAQHNASVVLDNLSPENLQKIGPAIRELTIPDKRVKAEFDRLKNACPLLNVLTDSMEFYSTKKGESAQVLSFNQQALTSIPGELTKMLLVCDAMDHIILSSDNILDPRAMSYLSEMKQTAWERMVRYHYYLALAYQYRFLKPYENPLDLQNLFHSFDTLAVQNADLSQEQYLALLPVFEQQIKKISDEIYVNFNNGTYSEFNEAITYTLSKDQLRELSEKRELKINIWESGKIPRDFTDCRITNMEIVEEKLKISVDTLLSDATLTLMMAHSGNSALIHPSTGEHFMFTQYNEDAAEYYNTTSLSPLGWAEKYAFYNGEISKVSRSLASESLIKYILDLAADRDLLIFTRPAGWAEIKLAALLNTGEQANMHFSIDSMTLRINIDYRSTTKFSNVLINCSDQLLPLILVDKPDLNGRTYGWGNFTRSFAPLTGTVRFTAPEKYGIYKFSNWKVTTNSGTSTVTTPVVDVNTLNHTWITANYLPNVPQLVVPDSVFVSWDQKSTDIQVSNNNVCGHLPMDWFTSNTCSWIRILDGTEKGTESGKISLQITDNLGATRRGEITVYAFDASNPERVVRIIQNANPFDIKEIPAAGSIRLYPNPAREEINVDLPPDIQGENLTLNIVSVDGRILRSINLTAVYASTVNIPLKGLANGLYLLELRYEDRQWLGKFNIQ